MDWILSSETIATTHEHLKNPSDTQYELSSVIYHKGNSVQVGHYVTYVNEGGSWILFNDERVSECPDAPINESYVAFYKISHSK